jgi:hypothetical protein
MGLLCFAAGWVKMTVEEGHVVEPFPSGSGIKSTDYKAENNESRRIQVRAGEFRCIGDVGLRGGQILP